MEHERIKNVGIALFLFWKGGLNVISFWGLYKIFSMPIGYRQYIGTVFSGK